MATSADDFAASPAAELIVQLLDDPAVIARMEELSRGGRPAVAALDDALTGRVNLTHPERQHVGRWVRDRMERRGWRTVRQRRIAGGTVFTSGTTYTRRSSDDPLADVPSALLPWPERVARVQAMVREASTNDYSVDDYLRDKYREAAEEEARYS